MELRAVKCAKCIYIFSHSPFSNHVSSHPWAIFWRMSWPFHWMALQGRDCSWSFDFPCGSHWRFRACSVDSEGRADRERSGELASFHGELASFHFYASPFMYRPILLTSCQSCHLLCIVLVSLRNALGLFHFWFHRLPRAAVFPLKRECFTCSLWLHLKWTLSAWENVCILEYFAELPCFTILSIFIVSFHHLWGEVWPSEKGQCCVSSSGPQNFFGWLSP